MARRSVKKSPRRLGTGPVVSRPTVFLPDCLSQVKLIAMRGASDDEIAETFGCDKDLFQRWKKAYPSFKQAIEMGRTHPDIEVFESLHKRAIGYEYTEDGLTRTGRVKALRRHMPGDVGAIKFWITNRKKDHWGEKSTVAVEGGPKGSEPVKIQSRDELIAGILALVQPKPDGPTRPTEKK